MEVVIERAALLNSLNHVQSVVERRNTIPILANVQIEAVEGAVALTATDLDIAVVERQKATIVQDGATTVSAHTLYDIVRKLPDGSEIRLAMKGGEGRLALSAACVRHARVACAGGHPRLAIHWILQTVKERNPHFQIQ